MRDGADGITHTFVCALFRMTQWSSMQCVWLGWFCRFISRNGAGGAKPWFLQYFRELVWISLPATFGFLELGRKSIVPNGNDDPSSFSFEYNFPYSMGKIWGTKEKANPLTFNHVCTKWKDWAGFNIEPLIGIVKRSRTFSPDVHFYRSIEWKSIN